MPRWPEELVAYRRSPEFTEGTIPGGLLKAHATKPGVWAKLHVLAGSLRFRDLESGEELLLSEGVHSRIFPASLHEVERCGPVRFFVEFYKPR